MSEGHVESRVFQFLEELREEQGEENMEEKDEKQFSLVFRVTEFLAEGCSQSLENLGVKETPIFVAETTGA